MENILDSIEEENIANLFRLKSHLQIAINNPQFKLNQIQKKPFEIV